MSTLIFLTISFLLTICFISGKTDNNIQTCHNSTGSCEHYGFVCANEEIIPHAKRCDGIEDCSDGTDEYLCNTKENTHNIYPYSSRLAVIESSCVKCSCYKGTIIIYSTNTAWFNIALLSPRDFTMMTNAPAFQNKPCNPAPGATLTIKLNVYKKANKGCRGYVCCFRQEECTSCGTGNTASHCW